MKKQFVLLAGLLLAAMFGTPALAADSPDQPAADKIDQYVLREMNAGQIPGLSLAILKEDKTIMLKGYGMADGSTPVTPQTPFTICSVGKVFTALAIRQLAGEGKVDYAAPVQQYIPWFTLADPEAAAKITIGNLVDHDSGLSTASGVEAYTYNAANTIEDVVRRLKNVKPDRPVGLSAEYSNLNFIILGLVIETVSGMPYGDYLQKYIFDPLEMKHSFTTTEAAVKDGLAVGHTTLYGITVPTRLPLPQAQVPAGFQLTSAEDMAKIAALYLNNGYIRSQSFFEHNELPEMKSPMLPYQRGETRYGTYFTLENGAPDGYLGYVGHVGASGDYTTVMFLSPERRTAIIVLANCNNQYANPAINAQTIANGIAYLMDTGIIPQARKLNRGEKLPYFIVLAVIMLLLGLRVLWVRRFRKNLARGRIRKILSLASYAIVDGMIPLFFLLVAPLLVDATWVYLLNSNPQLWVQVALASLVLAGVFLVKTALMLATAQRKAVDKDILTK